VLAMHWPNCQSIDLWHETGKHMRIRNARTYVDKREKPGPNQQTGLAGNRDTRIIAWQEHSGN